MTPQERAKRALMGVYVGPESGALAERCEARVADEIESAIAQAKAEEREACAEIVEAAYPCSCDEAYTGRGLTAPDCFRCVPLAEAAAEIRERTP